MNNPNRHRAIMFVILFGGFLVIMMGAAFVREEILRYVLFGIGIVMTVIATVYGIKKVRCPYCHALLSLKLTHTFTCPYCKKRIDD